MSVLAEYESLGVAGGEIRVKTEAINDIGEGGFGFGRLGWGLFGGHLVSEELFAQS